MELRVYLLAFETKETDMTKTILITGTSSGYGIESSQNDVRAQRGKCR
jgi:hypothetical protein